MWTWPEITWRTSPWARSAARKGSRSARQIASVGTPSGQIEWFFDVFLVQEQRIADLPELRAILASRRDLEATRAQRDEKRREHERLVQRQERLRKNIDAMHRHEQADKWRQELASSEERLTALEEIDLPGLEEKEQAVLQALDRQIEALSLVLDSES